MKRVSRVWHSLVLVGVFVLVVSGGWCAMGASLPVASSSPRVPSVAREGGRTVVFTSGALTPLKPHDFTNITFVGGIPVEVRLLGILFNRSLVQLLILHLVVPVVNLSFTVNYSRASILRHRYMPVSFVLNASGFSLLRNKAHTLVIQGFTGVLQFDRAKLIKGGLARFGFQGIARSVSVQRW